MKWQRLSPVIRGVCLLFGVVGLFATWALLSNFKRLEGSSATFAVIGVPALLVFLFAGISGRFPDFTLDTRAEGAGDANISVSPSDSWASVAINIFLALACFTLAGLTRDWTVVLAGFGFVAFIPSRFYSPTQYSKSLTEGAVTSAKATLSTPKWARVCDWVGIAFLLALYVVRSL